MSKQFQIGDIVMAGDDTTCGVIVDIAENSHGEALYIVYWFESKIAFRLHARYNFRIWLRSL